MADRPLRNVCRGLSMTYLGVGLAGMSIAAKYYVDTGDELRTSIVGVLSLIPLGGSAIAYRLAEYFED